MKASSYWKEISNKKVVDNFVEQVIIVQNPIKNKEEVIIVENPIKNKEEPKKIKPQMQDYEDYENPLIKQEAIIKPEKEGPYISSFS